MEVGGQAQCDCDSGYRNNSALACVPVEIHVNWAFAPGSRLCDDAYVSSVRVVLRQGSTSIIDEIVSCSGGGVEGVTLEEIENGSYLLKLTGLSSDSDEWYTLSQNLIVSNAQDQTLEKLVLKPTDQGDITFYWSFGTNKLGCDEAGVDKLRIQVKDSNNVLDYGPVLANCSDSGVTISDFDLGNWTVILEGVTQDLTSYQLLQPIIVGHPGENVYPTFVLDKL
jgi:hypothetical protein